MSKNEGSQAGSRGGKVQRPLNPAIYSLSNLRERGQRWFKLSGAMHKMVKSNMSYADYRKLADRHPIPQQIMMDVIRTMPEVYVDQPNTQAFLLGALEATGRTVQDSRGELERVLSTYVFALDYPGYSQGMNFVVYFLLMFLDEEQTFWMLVTLVQDLKVPDFYESIQCTGLLVDSAVLTDICLEKLRGLGRAVGEQTIQLLVQLVTPKCLISLSLSLLPIEISIYVLDIYFASPSLIQNGHLNVIDGSPQHSDNVVPSSPSQEALAFSKPLPPSFDVHHADSILFRLVFAILDIYYLREIRKLSNAQIAAIDQHRYKHLIREAHFINAAMARGRSEVQAQDDLLQWRLDQRSFHRGGKSALDRASCNLFGEDGSAVVTRFSPQKKVKGVKKSQVLPVSQAEKTLATNSKPFNTLGIPSLVSGLSHMYSASDVEALVKQSDALMTSLSQSTSDSHFETFHGSVEDDEDEPYTDFLALALCDAFCDPSKLHLDAIGSDLSESFDVADEDNQVGEESTTEQKSTEQNEYEFNSGVDEQSKENRDIQDLASPNISAQQKRRLLQRTSSIVDGRGVPDVARVWLGIAAVLERTPAELVLNRLLFDPRVFVSNKLLDSLRSTKRQLTLHSLRSKSAALAGLRSLPPDTLLDIAAAFRMRSIYHPYSKETLEALRERADSAYARQLRQAASTSQNPSEPVVRPRTLKADDAKETDDSEEIEDQATNKVLVLNTNPREKTPAAVTSHVPAYYFSATNAVLCKPDGGEASSLPTEGTNASASNELHARVTALSKRELELYHHLSFEGVKDFTLSPKQLFNLLRLVGVSENLLPPPDASDPIVIPASPVVAQSDSATQGQSASDTPLPVSAPILFNPLLDNASQAVPVKTTPTPSPEQSPSASPRLESNRSSKGVRPGGMSAFERLFALCDRNQTGVVDLRDIIMLLAMQMQSRLEATERLWFCFAANDSDSDGLLTHKEAKHLIVFLQNVALGQPLPERKPVTTKASQEETKDVLIGGDARDGGDEEEEGVLRFDECSELVMSEPFLSSALGLRMSDWENPQIAADRVAYEDAFGCTGCGIGDEACTIA